MLEVHGARQPELVSARLGAVLAAALRDHEGVAAGTPGDGHPAE
jgi:hypothetical protein